MLWEPLKSFQKTIKFENVKSQLQNQPSACSRNNLFLRIFNDLGNIQKLSETYLNRLSPVPVSPLHLGKLLPVVVAVRVEGEEIVEDDSRRVHVVLQQIFFFSTLNFSEISIFQLFQKFLKDILFRISNLKKAISQLF